MNRWIFILQPSAFILAFQHRRVNSDVGRLPVEPFCPNMLSKKVLQFILLTVLISWSVALAAYVLHIPYGSILLFVIIGVCYMPAPAYGTLILQQLIYRSPVHPLW